MKILITGALGHIGSKLIHSFRANTDRLDEIILLDNLSTQRYASLFNLPEGVRYRFFEEDVCNADLDKFFRGVEVVVHLAAMTEPGASFDRVSDVNEQNNKCANRVADACVRNNCALFFPSTTSIYSGQDEFLAEDCSVEKINPQSPYAEAKLHAEEYIERLGREKGLKYYIGRFGTIFGVSTGMRFHTAINKFCWQAILGQNITVWQTAINQCRPYLELNDAIGLIKFVIEKHIFDARIYNIATVNVTVNDIIKIISANLPDIKIKQINSKIMNDLSYGVSCDRIKQKGFKFKGDLKSGIKDIIALLSALSLKTI